MKIACDACDAKYSIADDKVRGKTFKIRCKKCSNVIVVRGVAEPATTPAPIDDDRVWYLVVHDDQVGPLTIDELRARFLDGDIDRNTFAWREGQPDWLPLSQVEQLATITAPAADAVTAEVAASNVARLRGERNESSVLFSLGNLAQIATRGPAQSAVSAGLESAPTQEGSGLIDIRSMASAYLGSGLMAKPAASIGSIADLPVFNTDSAFSEPAVLVPSAVRTAPSKLMYAMIAAMVAFAAIAIALLVILLHRAPAPAPPPAVVTTVVEPPSPPPVAPTPPPPARPVAVEPAPPPPPRPAPPPIRPRVAAVVPAPAPAPKQPKTDAKKASCDEIYCVVNTDAACCKSHAPLPPELTAAMIATAVSAVKGRVMACSARSSAKGRVRVHVSVDNDGHIANVAVEASPDDALGACVAAAVQHAMFPATQRGRSFSVPYTF